MMAPSSPAKITENVTIMDVDHPGADGLGDRGAERERRDEIEERRPDDGLARREHARRHHRRNRIGGVVKTVDVVEDQGDRDEADDDPEHRRAIRV